MSSRCEFNWVLSSLSINSTYILNMIKMNYLIRLNYLLVGDRIEKYHLLSVDNAVIVRFTVILGNFVLLRCLF